MTTLDEITESFDASGAIGSLADAIDSDESDAESLFDLGLPVLLARLGGHAATEESAAALHELTTDDCGAFFDKLHRFVRRGADSDLASALVDAIFGSERDAVEQQLSASTGLELSSVSRFLPVVAPGVLSLLGEFSIDDSADAAELAAMLSESDDPPDSLSDQDRAEFLEAVASVQAAGGMMALIPEAEPTGLGWLVPTLVVVVGLIAGLALWQWDDTSDTSLALSPEASQGRQVAKAFGCSACHGAAGQGVIGPGWQGLYLRQVELDDGTTVLADDEYLRRAIVDPQAEIVSDWTVIMPTSRLSDDDVDALIAYIKEL